MHRRELKEYFGNSFFNLQHIKTSKLTIFICFTNRCGSTYLASILNKYQLCGEPNEEMNYEHFNFSVIKEFSLKNNLNSFYGYVDYILSSKTNNDCFTSKLSLDQLKWFLNDKYIPRVFGSPKFIFMRRRDILLQAISFSIAVQTQKWTSFHDGILSREDLVFDPSVILAITIAIYKANAEFERIFLKYNLEPLTIYYENLIDSEQKIISDIDNFLGNKLVKNDENNFSPKSQYTEINALWRKQFLEFYSNDTEIIGRHIIN